MGVLLYWSVLDQGRRAVRFWADAFFGGAAEPVPRLDIAEEPVLQAEMPKTFPTWHDLDLKATELEMDRVRSGTLSPGYSEESHLERVA